MDNKKLITTRKYLKRLYVKGNRSLPQLKNYVRQYLGITTVLKGRYKLNLVTKGQLFLRGLLEKARRYILTRTGQNRNRPTTQDYKKLIDEVLKYVVAKENIKAFSKLEEFARKIQDLANATNSYKAQERAAATIVPQPSLQGRATTQTYASRPA